MPQKSFAATIRPMPKPDDQVTYRSIGGPYYPAKIVAEGPPGFFDLEVDIGRREPVLVRKAAAERIEPAINPQAYRREEIQQSPSVRSIPP